jgi:hypothetical protein
VATFPLDIRTELQLGGIWTDVSSDVYVRDVKQITRGLRDMASAADPSSFTFTLNNKGGKYSRRNAMSPLYGQLMQNTPVRVSVPGTGDSYLQLDGQEGCTATASAGGYTGGDLDVRFEMAGNWYGPMNQWVMGQWGAAGQQSWGIYMQVGAIGLRRTTGGDNNTSGYFYVQYLPVLPDRAALRVTLDVDNGSGGHTVTFYWAEDITAPNGWYLIGHPVTLDGVTSTFVSSSPFQLGITEHRDNVVDSNQRRPPNGRLYRAEIRNGIGGSVIASPDFRALADRAASATDSTGRVWTPSGSAEIRDREDRFMGEIAEWPLEWTTDDADVWTSVHANGIMRRLGQGAKALDSTLRRRIPSGSPVAYWPLEESQNATRAYSPIPGCPPASCTGVQWASMDTLPSSLPLPTLGDTAAFSGNVPAFDGGQWMLEMLYNAGDAAPSTDTEIISLTSPDGYIRRWQITMRLGLAVISGWDVTNTRQVWQGVSVGADVFHGWNRLRFWAQDDADGSGFSWTISWQDIGGDTGGFTGTVATGSCGSISVVSGDWTSANTQGWGVGHIYVLPSINSGLITGSDNAYSGEYATNRFMRLAGEENIELTRTPGPIGSVQVGYQRSDTVMNLFESIATADGGLLTEDPHRLALHYRSRSSMYTQNPALTLSYTDPGLGPDLAPTDDDVNVFNDVTVTRDGGSSARATLDTGPLSTQAPPNGIGKYDTTYTLSLGNDDDTDYLAYWKLHLGTWDGARWPSVSVMFHKPGADALVPAFLDMREGDKIRLTNLPQWVSNDDVDLIVLGWTETLDLYTWTVTFNCVPAGAWDTAVLEHAVFSTVDTDGTVLSQDATATATQLVTRVTSGPQWTDDPADFPFWIRAGGEVMQVNSVGPGRYDSFTRTVTAGWGTADSGQTWANAGGAAADFSVSSGNGVIAHPSKNVSRLTYMTSPSPDVSLVTNIAVSAMPTGDNIYGGLNARYNPTNGDRYHARLAFKPGGTLGIDIIRQSGGGTVTLGTVATIPGTFTAGAFITLKFEATGATLRMKAWPQNGPEPGWQLTVTDTTLTGAQYIGARSIVGSASANTLPVNVQFADITLTNHQAFTVQRSVNGVTKAQTAGTSVALANASLTSL